MSANEHRRPGRKNNRRKDTRRAGTYFKRSGMKHRDGETRSLNYQTEEV